MGDFSLILNRTEASTLASPEDPWLSATRFSHLSLDPIAAFEAPAMHITVPW